MDYKLVAVRVFVTDWERAVRFYTETLEIPVAARDDDLGWLELATGEAHLALERVDPTDTEATSLVGRFTGASLQVPDLLATYRHLEACGARFLSPPERQPWGGLLAHLRDPDGNVVTLFGVLGPQSL